MSDEERDKLRRGIHRFGFIDPITARIHPDGSGRWEIIDGENRWEVGVEEGLKSFPCFVVDATDDEARMLTPILNELGGQPDTQKLAALVKGLAESNPVESLRELLPYDRARFDELMGRVSVDWGALEQKRRDATEVEDRWVERVYRMPLAAAEVVDQAIAKAKEEAGQDNDWQGLEFISAEFMGR